MDDGSTDRSLEIAQSIDDPRVRVYSDGENKKLAARLNQIHSVAKFDLVARMDADDLMATDRIRRQLAFLVENPGIDLVTSGLCSITDDSVPYGTRGVGNGYVLTPERVLNGAHNIVHAAIVGRKRWFLRNPYDANDHLGQDYSLWVRASRKGDLSIGFLSEPLYYYREEGSVTPRKMLAGHKRRRRIICENGPSMIGVPRTTRVLCVSLLKSTVIRAAAATGLTGRLVRSRSAGANAEALAAVEADIKRLNAVPIPLMA